MSERRPVATSELHAWHMTTSTTFSELLRHPHDVIERLEQGDVVITRRGADALRLSKDSDSEADNEMVAAFAQLIGASVKDEEFGNHLVENLNTPYPWMEFLSAGSRREFMGEYLRTARACASAGRFDRLSIVVANWRETATAIAAGFDSTELDYIPGGLAVIDPHVDV